MLIAADRKTKQITVVCYPSTSYPCSETLARKLGEMLESTDQIMVVCGTVTDHETTFLIDINFDFDLVARMAILKIVRRIQDFLKGEMVTFDSKFSSSIPSLMDFLFAKPYP